MKTIVSITTASKKLLILLLAGVIIIGSGALLVRSSNRAFADFAEQGNKAYRDQLALSLTAQVGTAIVSSKFNLAEFDQYTKHPLRQELRKFVQSAEPQTDAYIQEIFLVDENNTIVISTELGHEGKTYTSPADGQYLTAGVPTVIPPGSKNAIGSVEVLWPILINKQFHGHIRALVRVNRNLTIEGARTISLGIYLLGAGIVSLLGLLLLFRSKPPAAGQPASGLEKASPETQDAPSEGELPEESGSVFSRLTELYQKTDDLDKSFQQSEEKIHSMMRVLNQGLLILDLNMNIITHNEYLLDVFHVRRTSTTQRKIYDLLQRNPRLLEIYRRAKDPFIYEVKQVLPINLLNGRKISVEVLARPFLNGENLTGVTFYIKNLDMLNELEKTLQKSMKYGVISQLSSSIGHEIRNPLSSLAIHTEIVDNMVSKSVEDEAHLKKIKKSISILNSEVERLQKLIDQFFTLAKAQEIQLSYENINDLIEEIYDLVHQQALEKNVRVTQYLANNLPMVKVSKDQLKQVIINLILNGFDAMPDGGELSIRTAFRDGSVVISVKDSGQGIPENIRDNIFDLYFTTKESGGGIGLAISRKIIEAHEGKLFFETQTGVGTIFYVELPTSQK